jgi:hypothetical protein
MGVSYERLDNITEAKSFYEKAYEIRKKAVPNSLACSSSLNSIGIALLK